MATNSNSKSKSEVKACDLEEGMIIKGYGKVTSVELSSPFVHVEYLGKNQKTPTPVSFGLNEPIELSE